jgi:hypothetical protein
MKKLPASSNSAGRQITLQLTGHARQMRVSITPSWRKFHKNEIKSPSGLLEKNKKKEKRVTEVKRRFCYK